ncbi:MAG: hypothetical protein K1X67_08130 [Fimbriimonadaceae bacterium]|nr:hypothetical protein [Fimbriimonadaceae bacterium]
MPKLTDLVPKPAASSINTGLKPCPTEKLIQLHGLPSDPLPAEPLGAAAITNKWWRDRMVTEDVGPFRVTGFKPAVAHLRASLNKVQARKPQLFKALGSAGMLAVRHVRGVPGQPSNHAFGMGIDFTILGKLDQMGDNMVMRGSLELYSILKEDLWYWLGAARREDGMHWEASKQLVDRWIAEGLL